MKLFDLVIVIQALCFTTVVVAQPAIELSLEASYKTGLFDLSAQEISVYSVCSNLIYATNNINNTIDVLQYISGNPSSLIKLRSLDLTPFQITPNSVDVSPGQVVAVSGTNSVISSEPGRVIFFTDDNVNNYLDNVTVGATPDMIKFWRNKLLVCNEAEPGIIDPIGSVSFITWSVSGGVLSTYENRVLFSSTGLDATTLRARGVRIFPNKTIDQDLEPEYLTIIKGRAYVTLQENNAIAVFDVDQEFLIDIYPLGVIPISQPGKSIDTNDKDLLYVPRNYSNVYGMFMPDTIASYKTNGRSYLVTANEGDARSEAKTVSSLILNETVFPNSNTTFKTDAFMGRLEVSNIDGLDPTGLAYDKLYAYGTRSFTIWNAKTMQMVYDSGNDFEQITVNQLGVANFNSNNNRASSGDNRSDNKGPEPEALALGNINGFTYAFVGLERVGGIMVYDITTPENATFVSYYNNRNFSLPISNINTGDLAPEGLQFIPAGWLASYPMLLTANEVSGTTSLYKITVNRAAILKTNTPPTCPV